MGAGNADIDANVARSSFVAKLAGGGPAAGKQAGHVAPGTLVHQLNGVVDGVDLHQPQDGTKNFRMGDFAGRRHLFALWLQKFSVPISTCISGQSNQDRRPSSAPFWIKQSCATLALEGLSHWSSAFGMQPVSTFAGCLRV